MIKVIQVKIQGRGVYTADGYELKVGRKYYCYIKNNVYLTMLIVGVPESTKNKRKVLAGAKYTVNYFKVNPQKVSIMNVLYVKNKKELKKLIEEKEDVN